MEIILRAIDALYGVFALAILIEIFRSWFFPGRTPGNPITHFASELVSTPLAKIRRLLPPLAGLDFSPLVFLIGIDVARSFLRMVVVAIF